MSDSTATPQPDPDSEEVAVYNALLRSQFTGDNIDHTRVTQTALLEKDLTAFRENIPLAPELVASFMERNQQPYPLKSVLDFGMDYQFLSSLGCFQSSSYWSWTSSLNGDTKRLCEQN